MTDQLNTVQAAELLGISPATLQKWRRAKHFRRSGLPYYWDPVKRICVYRRVDLESWKAKNALQLDRGKGARGYVSVEPSESEA